MGTAFPGGAVRADGLSDVSKGTGNQDYGEYTKHDYLKRLSDLLAEHGRKSGADLKMLLDPSMKSAMERRNKEGV